jgi:hypothetical protein
MKSQEDHQKHIEALKAKINKASNDAIQNYKIENPSIADAIAVRKEILVYKKKPKGVSKIVPAIVLDILLCAGEMKTQQDYIDVVNSRFPEYSIKRGIFSRPLKPYEKSAIKAKINSNSMFFIDIDDCKTLSHVKTRIERRFAEEAGKTYKVKLKSISCSKDTLFVGGKSYAITRRGSGSKPCVRKEVKGKSVWIRVDALLRLLENR